MATGDYPWNTLRATTTSTASRTGQPTYPSLKRAWLFDTS